MCSRHLLLLGSLLAFHPAQAHSWKADAAPIFDEALRAHLLTEWEQKQKPSQGEIQIPQIASTASTLHLAAAAAAQAQNAPVQSRPFQAFSKLQLRWDADFLHVGSNGLPDHGMMVGITAWQQQVPLPQAYMGSNAWSIPLHPVPAQEPALIKGRFLRGAIALAANGIPIFNPQNNRGEISQEIGELDQWGGHCGRADDYHYHAAPLHLQAIVGKELPIAYALDGYPIYGLTEPDGSPVGKLDVCQGHETTSLGYHYHASTKYPYVMGGFHGEVTEAEGQVDPQPRASPVRPDTPPLRGAEITDFESTGPNSYRLSYTVAGEKRSVSYSLNADGTYPFEYDNGSDGLVKEVYTARAGSGGQRGGEHRNKKGGLRKGSPKEEAAPRREEPSTTALPTPSSPMDANGDGWVSAQEYAQQAKLNFSLDKTQGSLSQAMADARIAFLATDLNKDGQLDASELQTSQEVTQGVKPSSSSSGGFVLTSSAVEEGGSLPMDFTGDGSGATLPLSWKGAPVGTSSYALIMDHEAPGNEMKGYWTMWDIPATVTSLPKNVQGVGKLGIGFRGKVGYEPPHSKGPGEKTYVLHVYALSASPQIREPDSQVNREVLLAAIQGKILATADLRVVYARRGSAMESPAVEDRTGAPPPPPPDRRERPNRKGGSKNADSGGLIKPNLTDTMKLNVYADNWFMLYVNGRLVAVDSIQFTPHNVVSVNFLPEYPMTLAVLAKDNADPKTGLEYGTNIGDGGFILKFADGTVTNASWKAQNFFTGPLNQETKNPRVQQVALPDNWWAVDFDDSQWANAKEYSVEQVDPKQPYFDHDFDGAKFIWTQNLALDNTVIFRTCIDKPGWQPRWNTQPDLDVTGAPQR
ncbi:YHYH protein [Prosthecobacter dejongeii]|uniref:Phosphatidylethanolamine-binding protein (PEBP) family uncharacterized protein n=1 Tax=Prosthecobacter dejongeii TaxID=48465 RepID=A0A7W8DPA4_9BACT|nr:YHYH protein [Prosthecobacter dejongeii]MBB5036726.1 phosphatidylethanolamine-binding protein (PEBP) family uncharacterized protein [Prosthecobacter dejongeii]